MPVVWLVFNFLSKLARLQGVASTGILWSMTAGFIVYTNPPCAWLGDPARATVNDLENALNDLLANRPVAVSETQPFGCAIVR